MKFTQLNAKGIAGKLFCLFIMGAMFSCQKSTEPASESKQTETSMAVQAVADTVKRRPAPAFFVIPEELDKKRVWLCEDGVSDVFHEKHNCSVLIAGRGKGTFRSVSIHKAIETYGLYNCQTCSKELDHIFDENMVR